MFIIDNARFGYGGIRTVIDGIWRADEENIEKIIVPKFRFALLSFIYELLIIPYLLRNVDECVLWPNNRIGFFLSSKLKKNSIVIVHDIQAIEYPQNYNFIVRLWRTIMLKRLRKHQIRVTSISMYTKYAISEKLKLDSTLIYPSVVLKRPPVVERGDYFLYYGSAAKNKRIELLLSNYNEYRRRGGDKRLVLVLSRKYEDFVKNHAKELVPTITVYNGLTDFELSGLLAGCWKVLSTSNYEGFGLFVLEGWKFSKEVIVFNNSNLSYFNKMIGINIQSNTDFVNRMLSNEYKFLDYISWKKHYNWGNTLKILKELNETNHTKLK